MSCCVPIQRWTTVVREFLSNGELLNLSVALVIGDTFIKVMYSVVDYLLTPILGFLFDGIAIGDLQTQLHSNRWPDKVPVTLWYGKVLQQLIYFVIIAVTLSLLILIIKCITGGHRRNRTATEALPTRQELILMEHTKLLQAMEYSLRK